MGNKATSKFYFGEKFYIGSFWMASVTHILKLGLYKSLFIKLWWTIWRVIQVNIKKFLGGLKKKQRLERNPTLNSDML